MKLLHDLIIYYSICYFESEEIYLQWFMSTFLSRFTFFSSFLGLLVNQKLPRVVCRVWCTAFPGRKCGRFEVVVAPVMGSLTPHMEDFYTHSVSLVYYHQRQDTLITIMCF